MFTSRFGTIPYGQTAAGVDAQLHRDVLALLRAELTNHGIAVESDVDRNIAWEVPPSPEVPERSNGHKATITRDSDVNRQTVSGIVTLLMRDALRRQNVRTVYVMHGELAQTNWDRPVPANGLPVMWALNTKKARW